ncbi:MAG: DUF1622 domain-containing protein [Clostridia bacterium]|nr:DUF1622 domain-containing protein [Clostridia bacterium]
MEILENFLSQFVGVAIILFEFTGAVVITLAGIKGVINLLTRNPKTRLNLAYGLAMGLEFKLGSEILRTVVVRELSEIVIAGCIILLRAALTLLIHWEIHNEEANEKLNEEIKTKKSFFKNNG